MRKSKKVWTNKKIGKKKKYEGCYEFKKNAARIFVLKPIGFDAAEHVFDSPEAARKLGWV